MQMCSESFFFPSFLPSFLSLRGMRVPGSMSVYRCRRSCLSASGPETEGRTFIGRRWPCVGDRTTPTTATQPLHTPMANDLKHLNLDYIRVIESASTQPGTFSQNPRCRRNDLPSHLPITLCTSKLNLRAAAALYTSPPMQLICVTSCSVWCALKLD